MQRSTTKNVLELENIRTIVLEISKKVLSMKKCITGCSE